MENDRNNLVIILAGYEKEMTDFLSTNPGMMSRINRYIHFQDYNTQELTDIFTKMTSKNAYSLSPESQKILHEKMQYVFSSFISIEAIRLACSSIHFSNKLRTKRALPKVLLL